MEPADLCLRFRREQYQQCSLGELRNAPQASSAGSPAESIARETQLYFLQYRLLKNILEKKIRAQLPILAAIDGKLSSLSRLNKGLRG